MRHKLPGALLALVVALFIISGSVCAVLFCRGIYRLDLEYLDIPGQSGLSREACLENYNALIDYCSVFSRQSRLELPGLPMSEKGEAHFYEVRLIFHGIQYLCALSAALAVMLGLSCFRRGDYSALRPAGIIAISPLALLCPILILGWKRVFRSFHTLFFRNDNWLFNRSTDPIINILPREFFLHCALAILALCILGGFSCLLAHALLGKKAGKPKIFLKKSS